MDRKRILCFASYFLPGFRAGGPIRSLQRTIDALNADFEFKVVTRDRDLGSPVPYPGLIEDRWSEVEGISIWYLRGAISEPVTLRRLIADCRPDLLYFHAFWDPRAVAMPLLLRRLGLVPSSVPALVAPRGEFAPGALAIKRWWKSGWLMLVRLLGLYRDVSWHASNEVEAEQIRAIWGPHANVLLASDLPPRITSTAPPPRRPKVKGGLRLVFLSRISPMKNLDGALRLLGKVKTPMSLDIYGTRESEEYWNECERLRQELPPHITVTHHGTAPPDEVIRVLSSYDLFLLPTLGENFGHAILEALLAGCPVLISDRTPWSCLQEERAGYALRLDQPAAFVEALEQFAAMDDAEFRQWSDGALRVAREYCADDGMRQQVRTALESAMTKLIASR
jgi:glycosyltransferase involved in cell wall biosynthesis